MVATKSSSECPASESSAKEPVITPMTPLAMVSPAEAKIDPSAACSFVFDIGFRSRERTVGGAASISSRLAGYVVLRHMGVMKETHRLSRRFCIAPMMDWTDRHCRFFHRLLTRHALIYTEMVTTGAIIHGDRARLLAFHPSEHPVALQLGGSDPAALVRSARIAEDFGYDEINLNVGCPSDRVQEGRFGACLMAEPVLVGECISAMKSAVAIPVTAKCRIGIDEQDPEE